MVFNVSALFFVFLYNLCCERHYKGWLSSKFEYCFCICFLMVNSYLIASSGGLIDYTHYEAFYEACHEVNIFWECYALSASALGSSEFIFVQFTYVALMYGLSFFEFCFAICLFFLFFLFVSYLRLDKNGFTCFIVLFTTSSIVFLFGNTLRQAMAVPFILLFISAVDLKRYKEAILFFLVAFFCHYSSLLVLVVYLLLSGFVGRSSKSVMVSATLLGVAGGGALYYFYGLDIFNLIAYKLHYYLGGEFNFTNVFSMTFISGVFFVLLAFYLKVKGVYRYNDSVLLFYFACVLVSFLFVFNDVIYNRVTLYRTVIEVIVLARVLMCFSLGSLRIYVLYPVLAVCYLVANFYSSPAYTIFSKLGS